MPTTEATKLMSRGAAKKTRMIQMVRKMFSQNSGFLDVTGSFNMTGSFNPNQATSFRSPIKMT